MSASGTLLGGGTYSEFECEGFGRFVVERGCVGVAISGGGLRFRGALIGGRMG